MIIPDGEKHRIHVKHTNAYIFNTDAIILGVKAM